MNALVWVGILILGIHSADAQEQSFSLPEIKVEGSSLDANYIESLPAVTKLSGKNLERRKQSTIGETLSQEPGVSSTFFGPNASRPVIRGLDGDRIRIMENGTGTLDASAASPDHAVSVDPLVVDSIDIVRGPSALLYGSTAVGGVVNIKTKRIASHMLEANELSATGKLSSVDRGRALGVLGRAKNGYWVIEADASGRGSEDYDVPGEVRSKTEQAHAPLAAGEREETARVRNSANRTYQEGVGATYIKDDQHIGAAISSVQSLYGTVAEKNVLIDLQRFRLDLEVEKRFSSFIQTARIKGAATVYRHKEIEWDTIGTTFRNRGGELRGDFKHQKIGAMEGSFGFQSQLFRFEASGEEAFLPSTLNQSHAVFAFEEWKIDHLRLSMGIRLDDSQVKADNDAHFGPELNRHFFLPSASLGLTYALTETTDAGLNLTFTQRAPNYQELFASGVHVATGTHEAGNRNLPAERSLGTELFIREKSRDREIRGGVFVQNFSSFIALSPTGELTPPDPDTGEQFKEYEFNSVSALLTGAEFQWISKIPGKFWDGNFETEFQADFVRGIDRTHSGNLPRLPPVREGLTVNYRRHGWTTFFQAQRSEAQGLIAENELPTNAFTLIHAGVEAPIKNVFGELRWNFRVNNIFDTEARTHTSFLKDVAPFPGRNFILSLQAAI